MPLNKAQTAVAGSNARFRVFVAGRRTGKTFLSVRELAKFARHPNKKVLYVCPTYGMARDIIWEDLKRKLTSLRWIAKTNESRLELKLVNGSTITLRSGDNPDSLRGGGYDFVVFDECADLKPELWTEVIRPALSAQNPPGSALFCGTPKGHNWFKGLYDQGRNKDGEFESWQFCTLDGGNVPEAEIEAAKRDLSEKVFSQEYMATFESYSGIIAYNFKDENILKYEEPEKPIRELIVGLDFNVDPMCAVIYTRTHNGLHAIDELVIGGSNTDEMCEEIKNRYPTQRITVFPDPSGVQRRTSAGGRTDISILQNAGFQVVYKPRHPAVKDRINATNSLLLNTNKERRLFVDPKCRNLIKSFREYTYKESTQIPNKDTGVDHIFDAATYVIDYLFPITREVTRKNPKSFGVF
jgi:phage terminase large subunit